MKRHTVVIENHRELIPVINAVLAKHSLRSVSGIPDDPISSFFIDEKGYDSYINAGSDEGNTPGYWYRERDYGPQFNLLTQLGEWYEFVESKSLPNKPSELLSIALKDLELVEQDPDYAVDMRSWHVPGIGVCQVCLAGGVMAKELSVPKSSQKEPGSFPRELYNKLVALDYLRCGRLGSAMNALDLPIGTMPVQLLVTNYHNNRVEFMKDMRNIIQVLQAAGQ